MKKLLIISQYFTPDITAAAYRMEDMYHAVKDIFEVDVITTIPHKSNEAIDNVNQKNIYRVDIRNNSSNKIIKRMNEYFYFTWKSIVLSTKLKKNYDYVFATSPPIFVLASGLVVSFLKKSKLIIDIRDIWPDGLADDGTVPEDSFIYKLTKKFEIYIYKKAYKIICVSKYTKAYIDHISKSNKTSLVYNGISDNLPLSADNGKFCERKRNKLQLYYVGNLGHSQHIDVLISTLIKYAELNNYYEVQIIGSGTELKRLQEVITENNLLHVTLRGPINKIKATEEVLNKADVLWLNLFHSITKERTIPSKLFDYLYYNLPIIYGIKGEGKEILDTLGCGVGFEWNDEESLKNALVEIYQNYSTYLIKSKGNYKYVKEKFDRKTMFMEFWEKM